MSNLEHTTLLATLSNVTSIEARVTALRAIKNNITGHDLRKAEYVCGGLIPLLARILHQTHPAPSQDLTESLETKVWVHTTGILGSVAYGGPSFVQPLLSSSIVPQLLARLSLGPANRLSLAILRCLNVLADNLPLASAGDWNTDRRLATWLYSAPTNLTCFTRFIEGASNSILSQQTCDAALALICKTCVDHSQKQLLVRAGVLAALGARLASFIVADGLVIPGIDAHGVDFQDRGPLPPAAPGYAHMSPVFETLALLIESSRTYASDLLYHPTILAVLPFMSDDFSPAEIRKSPWGSSYFSGGAVPRPRPQTPLDLLLPMVPENDKSDSGAGFPPLGSTLPGPKRRSPSIQPISENISMPFASDQITMQQDCLLVPWLVYMIRAYRGKRRVVASRLLINILNHGLTNSTRIRPAKALVVPLLVQALDSKFVEDGERSRLLTGLPYLESVPCVLAKFIMDDEQSQKIAVDSKAISKLAACLKMTFEPPNEKAVLWRPRKQIVRPRNEGGDCALGSGGPSLLDRSTMAYREGLLQALAAIAPFNDHYRKEICDQGVLTQIMLALEPFRSEATMTAGGEPSVATWGNSASTLLAACDAVRALTRSVTALRTKLVDADIGKAIVRLLHSSDPEVTIAATKVITNLAIDFSPMKPSVSEPALVKKLCEQAHSANARLRLESIWALKHLVLNSTNKLKRDVIDELGANWIRHLIATDPYDIPPGEVIGLVAREYPPRSSFMSGTSDVIMSEDSDDDETVTIDAIRDTPDYTRHTVEDDLAIQEQLLDLLRNLFCGDNSAEIVEYVLAEVGHADFLKIIMDRLKSKSSTGTIRKVNVALAAPPGIVLATLNILIHLAACQPKFRNMISANAALTRLILTFYQHPERQIRSAMCWIVINLTYGDNLADRDACKVRASEMNKAGYLSHMRRMMESDTELDVRERAKTAVGLLEKLVPREHHK